MSEGEWQKGELVRIVGPALGQDENDPEEQQVMGKIRRLWHPRGEGCWYVEMGNGLVACYEVESLQWIAGERSGQG